MSKLTIPKEEYNWIQSNKLNIFDYVLFRVGEFVDFIDFYYCLH